MSSKTAKKPATGSLQKAAKPVKKPFSLKAIGSKAPKTPITKEVADANRNAAASEFALEDSVEIPPRKHGGGGAVSPYPFKHMKPSQSFFVAAEIERGLYTTEAEADEAQLEESRKVVNRMTGAVRRFSKLNDGYKFTVRTVSDPHGVRVWRTDGSK